MCTMRTRDIFFKLDLLASKRVNCLKQKMNGWLRFTGRSLLCHWNEEEKRGMNCLHSSELN